MNVTDTTDTTSTNPAGPSPTGPRRRTVAAVAVTLGAVAALGLGIAATAEARQVGPFGMAPTATTTSVDADVAAGLQYSREEERLARDVYAALAARYDNAAPFSMITRSEQVHYDAVGTLLERYGIADPSAGRAAGSYADPTLQALYTDLMAKGSASLDAAYDVGIAIEKQDIADLDKELAGTLPADVRTVLTNLRSGSEHHLTSFTNAADGVTTGGGYGAGGAGRWGDSSATPGGSTPMGGMGHGGPGNGTWGAGPASTSI